MLNNQQSTTPSVNNSQGQAPYSISLFGSANISIASLMAVLEAQLQIMNMSAELSQTTTAMRAAANQSVAESGIQAGAADADVYTQSAGEQYSSLASSLGQVTCGFTGLSLTTRAARNSDGIGKLAERSVGFGIRDPQHAIGDQNRESFRDPNTPAGKIALEYKNLLLEAKSGGKGISLEDYKKIVHGGGENFNLAKLKDPNTTETVTLDDVFSLGTPDEKAKMRIALGKAKTDAGMELDKVNTNIQNLVQIGNNATSATSQCLQAQNKMMEAQDTRNKASYNVENQLSQSEAAFLGDAGKSQSDQSDKAGSATSQTLQTIAQLVQVDTRG